MALQKFSKSQKLSENQKNTGSRANGSPAETTLVSCQLAFLAEASKNHEAKVFRKCRPSSLCVASIGAKSTSVRGGKSDHKIAIVVIRAGTFKTGEVTPQKRTARWMMQKLGCKRHWEMYKGEGHSPSPLSQGSSRRKKFHRSDAKSHILRTLRGPG